MKKEEFSDTSDSIWFCALLTRRLTCAVRQERTILMAEPNEIHGLFSKSCDVALNVEECKINILLQVRKNALQVNPKKTLSSYFCYPESCKHHTGSSFGVFKSGSSCARWIRTQTNSAGHKEEEKMGERAVCLWQDFGHSEGWSLPGRACGFLAPPKETPQRTLCTPEPRPMRASSPASSPPHHRPTSLATLRSCNYSALVPLLHLPLLKLHPSIAPLLPRILPLIHQNPPPIQHRKSVENDNLKNFNHTRQPKLIPWHKSLKTIWTQ